MNMDEHGWTWMNYVRLLWSTMYTQCTHCSIHLMLDSQPKLSCIEQLWNSNSPRCLYEIFYAQYTVVHATRNISKITGHMLRRYLSWFSSASRDVTLGDLEAKVPVGNCVEAIARDVCTESAWSSEARSQGQNGLHAVPSAWYIADGS